LLCLPRSESQLMRIGRRLRGLRDVRDVSRM